MSEQENKELVAALESAVAAHLDKARTGDAQDGSDFDGSHDIHHSRRVLENAQQIADGEAATDGATGSTIDRRLLVAGAYLHDLVNVPKNSPQRAEASALSAVAATPLMESVGFSDDECRAVSHMIVSHSFSANIKPETVEAKILQDADRLEAIGAIGIARVFYIAGKLDSSLFNGDDPFAKNRDLDDKTYALDHFRVKLLGLPETMQTVTGKMLAEQRAQTMIQFLDAIAEELSAKNPWH